MFAPFTRPECRSSGQIGDKSCLYSDPKGSKISKTEYISDGGWLQNEYSFFIYSSEHLILSVGDKHLF